MPIGFQWANNLAQVVLIGEKGSTDVLQGSPLIIVDKLPPFNFLLISAGVVFLLVVVLINWLITRREKKESLKASSQTVLQD